MLSLLISLLIVAVILGVMWVILSKIPIPAEIKWLVDVVFLIIALVAVVSILGGYWSFPIGHPFLR